MTVSPASSEDVIILFATNQKPDILFDEAVYRQLAYELKARTGVGLNGYRPGIAQRRIARRARSLDFKTLEEYLSFLRNSPSEAENLAKMITLPVGRFFRNRDVFDIIEKKVFPAIFSDAAAASKITFWNAGCGEGEEPYGLAMVLDKKFNKECKLFRLRIIATDVNPGALQNAKIACYDKEKLMEVDAGTKNRYFIQEGKVWRVRDEIREMVEFRRESLPDGTGVPSSDMVMLRNLLIYFDRERQELILKKVIGCIKPGGFLVLGKAETLPAVFRNVFETISSPQRIYRKAI